MGAWIINTSKHLYNFDNTNPSFTSLENLFFAGKCGSLLVKISADATEQLSDTKVKAHARLCGISGPELRIYLDTLKASGCIDWDNTHSVYEVLAFTRQRVLETASQILLGAVGITPIEQVLPEFLEYCLVRPRLEAEAKAFLSERLKEKDVNHLLGLVANFELLGVLPIRSKSDRLFFNSYQFGNRAEDIGNALSALSTELREKLNELLEKVASRPGIPPEDTGIPVEIRKMAIGLGLVEVSKVPSSAGDAKFLTLPRLAPPSVGVETERLEEDVFHHAKILLSSLRFGELRSSLSRGRIIDPPVLVNALLQRDRVGPCTAIGQDYTLPEGEGIIRTVRASHKPGNQFYMELRRREPAEIVLNILESGSVSTVSGSMLQQSLELPTGFVGPEASRVPARSRLVKNDPETMKRFLEALRT